MSKQTEALRLALEALGYFEKAGLATLKTIDAITAIREALAEAQQQEPVAWKDEQGNVRMTLDAGEIQSSVGYVYSVHGERIKNACIRSDIPNGTPLYTSPPASKPWVGLTEQEHTDIAIQCGCMSADWVFYGATVERILKEKNS